MVLRKVRILTWFRNFRMALRKVRIFTWLRNSRMALRKVRLLTWLRSFGIAQPSEDSYFAQDHSRMIDKVLLCAEHIHAFACLSEKEALPNITK